jgi:hypothetical protein
MRPVYRSFAGTVIGSAAMRLSCFSDSRWGGKLGTVLLLLGLCAAVVIPQDVVWCRCGTGHNALESAWSTCCAPANGGASCASWPVSPGFGRDLALPGLNTIHCADLWLGAPGADAPSPIPQPRGPEAVSAPMAIAPVMLGAHHAVAESLLKPHVRQVQELIATTVLTV